MKLRLTILLYFSIRIYIVIFINFILTSCSNESESETHITTTKDTLDISQSGSTLTQKPTRTANHRLDSLLKKFTLTRNYEFGVPVYHHKKWFGRYRQALTAGVDTTGGLYLVGWSDDLKAMNAISNYTLSKKANIFVEIGDSIFHTLSEVSPINTYISENYKIHECRPEGDSMLALFYLSGPENDVIKKIVQAKGKKVTFYFSVNNTILTPRYLLSKRDMDALKDCYELSQLLK